MAYPYDSYYDPMTAPGPTYNPNLLYGQSSAPSSAGTGMAGAAGGAALMGFPEISAALGLGSLAFGIFQGHKQQKAAEKAAKAQALAQAQANLVRAAAGNAGAVQAASVPYIPGPDIAQAGLQAAAILGNYGNEQDQAKTQAAALSRAQAETNLANAQAQYYQDGGSVKPQNPWGPISSAANEIDSRLGKSTGIDPKTGQLIYPKPTPEEAKILAARQAYAAQVASQIVGPSSPPAVTPPSSAGSGVSFQGIPVTF